MCSALFMTVQLSYFTNCAAGANGEWPAVCGMIEDVLEMCRRRPPTHAEADLRHFQQNEIRGRGFNA